MKVTNSYHHQTKSWFVPCVMVSLRIQYRERFAITCSVDRVCKDGWIKPQDVPWIVDSCPYHSYDHHPRSSSTWSTDLKSSVCTKKTAVIGSYDLEIWMNTCHGVPSTQGIQNHTSYGQRILHLWDSYESWRISNKICLPSRNQLDYCPKISNCKKNWRKSSMTTLIDSVKWSLIWRNNSRE